MFCSLLTAKQILALCIPSVVLPPVADQLVLTKEQTFLLFLPPQQQESQLTKQPKTPRAQDQSLCIAASCRLTVPTGRGSAPSRLSFSY